MLQNWGDDNELLFTVIDPTMLTDTCDLPIKSRVTEDGQPLWSVRDPVHLTGAAYQDLAAVIRDTALAIEPADSASASGSNAGTHKKRRAESVVTMPPASARKKFRGTTRIKVAGWLLGKTEHSTTAVTSRGRGTGCGTGRGTGWHGRGPAGAGSNRRARGGWYQPPPDNRRGGWRGWNW